MAAARPADIALLLAACLALGATPPVRKAGVGTVSGEGRGVYLLKSPKPVTLPSYEVAGFAQKALPVGGAWRIEISVDLAPGRVRSPFRLRAGDLPPYLGGPDSKQLAQILRGCLRTGEAVDAVLLFFRDRIRYAPKVDFPEEPAEVSRRREASCVGMTRLCASVIQSQGIRCREVLGLKVPIGEGAKTLEGGVLHAWLEVDFGEEGRAFYDPWRSCGWVPESFVVLRAGGGLAPGEFSALLGGTVGVESHRDRVFFEPAPGVANLLWKRPEAEVFTGTLLTGKVLGPSDAPLAGRAVLRGQGGEVSMDFWEGNFFFRDLEPGAYALLLEAPGVSPEATPVTVGPMDKRRFLVYSRNARERGNDGAGRQP